MTLNERKQKFMLSFLKQFLSNLAIIVFCNGLFCILQQYSNYSCLSINNLNRRSLNAKLGILLLLFCLIC